MQHSFSKYTNDNPTKTEKAIAWAFLGASAYFAFKTPIEEVSLLENPRQDDFLKLTSNPGIVSDKDFSISSNPKSVKDYRKMFKIFDELNHATSINRQISEGDIQIFNPSDLSFQSIIDDYVRVDRIETFIHAVRYEYLSTFFHELSINVLLPYWSGIRAKLDEDKHNLLPNIEKYCETIETVLNDKRISKAYAMWKKYYAKRNDYDPNDLPRMEWESRKQQPSAVKDYFGEDSWKFKLLTQYLAYATRYERAQSQGARNIQNINHFTTMMRNNARFRRAANHVVWDAYKPETTIAELYVIEQNMDFGDGKELEDATEEVWLDLGEWKWVIADPNEEAEMMGHCGREGDEMIMLSLRHYDKKDKIVSAHISVAFYWIEDDEWGYVTQMKGRKNSKPTEKYHPYILKLLQDERVQIKLKGAYAAQNDFSLEDLTQDQINDLFETKPQLFSIKDFIKNSPKEKINQLFQKYDLDYEVGDIDGDVLVLQEWEDVDSFVSDMNDKISTAYNQTLAQYWTWSQDWHDTGYYPKWDNVFNQTHGDIYDLVGHMKSYQKDSYHILENYLDTLYPGLEVLPALEKLEEEE